MAKARKSRTAKPPTRPASAPARKRPTKRSAAAAVTGWQVVYVEGTFAPGEQKVVIAKCPPGKRVLGGGYFPKDFQSELDILGSWPSDATGSGITADGSSWALYARHTGTNSPSIVVYAICASVLP
jgi:hypothetical protein